MELKQFEAYAVSGALNRVAREAKVLQELSYELVRDQLQLTRQADVFLRFCWFTLKSF